MWDIDICVPCLLLWYIPVYKREICVCIRCTCVCIRDVCVGVYTHTHVSIDTCPACSLTHLSPISLSYTHTYAHILWYITIILKLSLSITVYALSLSLSLSLSVSLSLSLSLMYTQMQAPEAIECRRGLQLLRASGRDLSLECVLHRMCSL